MEKMIQRDIEPNILKWLDNKEIIAIRGPRQCGKTTLLKKITKILLEKKVDKKNIHYTSFEDDFEIEKFEKNPKDYISFKKNKGKKNYFLLDEVQYIKQAGKLLKLIYDSIPDIKIIITGSSTLDINEIGSYLVGRVLLFDMYPFSFNEFLIAKDKKLHKYYISKKVHFNNTNIKEEELIYIEELNILLKEYITYGGYPAVVLEKDTEKKKVLLKNLFQTYIEKDIVKVYGSRYKQRISDMIRYLSSLNAEMINYNEISSVISLYDKEVKELISILEESYIIKCLRPFHKNLTTELRKNPKIYFIDTGLRNIAAGLFDFSEKEFGKLLENHLLRIFEDKKVNYWRTTAKAEVDFIVDEKIPVESKTTPKITRSFRSFIDTYKPKTAFIVNKNKLEKHKISKVKIFYVPFSVFG